MKFCRSISVSLGFREITGSINPPPAQRETPSLSFNLELHSSFLVPGRHSIIQFNSINNKNIYLSLILDLINYCSFVLSDFFYNLRVFYYF